MHIRLLTLTISFLVGLPCLAQNNSSIQTKTKILHLPKRKVEVKIHSNGSGPVFFNMHDDENTSTLAMLQVLADSGGSYIELVHTGARNISFKKGKKTYIFDPNRIYTDEGIKATLERNGKYDEKALKEVRKFAQDLIEIVLKESPNYIFTLHNNTPDNLTVYSFDKGREYENDAAYIYADTSKDHDDFILVTQRVMFDFYTASNQNTVLQNQNPTNDGSLSVWAALNNVPYLNIEAEHGHVEQQKVMIILTYQMLKHPVFGHWNKKKQAKTRLKEQGF